MRTLLVVLFLALSLIGLSATTHANEIQRKPTQSVSASNGLIDIAAMDVGFKGILREIESKAGVKVVIFDGVEDRKVSISIKSLPVFSLGTMLKQMGLKNTAVVYDSALAALVVYVLPEGADISEILKGKHVIRQADFPNPDHAISIKGKAIETIRKRADGPALIKDELLLRFHRGVEQGEIDEILKKHNLEAVADATLSKIGYLKAKITDGRDVPEVVKAVRQEYKIKVPEPNYVLGSLAVTDPLYSEQWSVPETRFDKAWEIAKSKDTVTVDVVDSGVDSRHPDLTGKILAGYDFVNDDSDASDDHGHGTFVAGNIAVYANDIGIKGLDGNARILPVRSSDSNDVGTYEDVAKGIV